MPGFFSVKGFEKFQHYKDRTPPWIKLYNELLDDYDFGGLPDASKMHLVAIWLLASRYSNRIPFDAKWIARRINATDPVDLRILADTGFILPEQECSTMLAECKQSAMPEEEREGETEEDSEPIGSSAASAHADIKALIFGRWLHWFAEHTDKTKAQLRPMFGRWCSRYGDAAAGEAVYITIRAGPVDPVGYTESLLNGKAKPPNGHDFSMSAVLEELSDEYRRESTGEPDHHDADGDAVRPAAPY